MATSPDAGGLGADVDVEVAVVGAGPAGVAAAVTAAEAGASVLLLDAGARPGGQYYLRPADDRVITTATHAWPAFDDLEARLNRAAA